MGVPLAPLTAVRFARPLCRATPCRSTRGSCRHLQQQPGATAEGQPIDRHLAALVVGQQSDLPATPTFLELVVRGSA